MRSEKTHEKKKTISLNMYMSRWGEQRTMNKEDENPEEKTNIRDGEFQMALVMSSPSVSQSTDHHIMTEKERVVRVG